MSARSGRGDPPGAWDPVRDLVTLKERMNRLLETVLRRGEFSQDGFPGWSPAMDLREDREGFLLTAELPGVRRGDIAVRVDGGVLTVEGRRAPDPGLRSAEPLRIEMSYGAFARAFPLPAPVDDTRVTARFRLGVLEVFLPRAAEARSRTIAVEVS
jgi:HSP20 family protein